MIKIYTDGSCLSNPGNGGWAAIININGEIKKIKTFGVVSAGTLKKHYDGLILMQIWGISIVNFWPKNHTKCQKIEKSFSRS